MTTLIDITKAIVNIQRDSGLSTPNLAKKAGVSKAGLYRFLNGEDVRLSTVLAVLDALQVDFLTVPRSVSHVLQANMESKAAASGTVTTSPRVRVHSQTAVGGRLARLHTAIEASRGKK